MISMGVPSIVSPFTAAVSRSQVRARIPGPGIISPPSPLVSLFSSTTTPQAAAAAEAAQPAVTAEPDKKQQKQNTKKVKGEKVEKVPEVSYYEQKAAAKLHRRALHDKSVERRERMKTRRAGRPRTFHRNEFRAFFIPHKVNDEFHHRKARQLGLEWELQAAAIVQRPNVVQPDREPWEVEMEQLQTHLSQYGKRYPKELVGDIYPDESYKPLDQDELLDKLPFRPAPRETPADASGDIRTVDRKLKSSIYLFVKNNTNRWEFPSVTLNPDELLLDGAKRALQPLYGMKYWCPSNAPWSVQLSPFTTHERQQQKPGLYGRKTFFVLLQYDTGAVPDHLDYGWLDRDEITQRVEEQENGKQISKLYHYML
jgi:large subunit ribosomal protein L46